MLNATTRRPVPLGRSSRMSRQQEQTARLDRIRAAHEETRAIVAAGVCPRCQSKLRRNLSLSGWWQCEQFGAVGFRKDSAKPSCDWQGFTE